LNESNIFIPFNFKIKYYYKFKKKLMSINQKNIENIKNTLSCSTDVATRLLNDSNQNLEMAINNYFMNP